MKHFLLSIAFIINVGCLKLSKKAEEPGSNSSKSNSTVEYKRQVLNLSAMVKIDLVKILNDYPEAKHIAILSEGGNTGLSITSDEARIVKALELNYPTGGFFNVTVTNHDGSRIVYKDKR